MTPLDPLRVPLRGSQLIEASAGTGKTHTIATLFVRLVLERRLLPDRILVVTFTNAATAELRDRIRRRLRDALSAFENEGASPDPTLSQIFRESRGREADRAQLARALTLADESAVHTIHGFCQRVLQEQAFDGGVRPGLTLLPDVAPLLGEIVQDFWTLKVSRAERAQVEYLASRGIGPSQFFDLGLRAMRARDARVVADVEPGGDAALARYFEVRKRAAAELRDGRDAVRDILLDSPALKRNLYTPAACARLLSLLDALVSAEEGSLAGSDAEDLDKLTPEGLARGVKKDARAPHHPFFATCAELVRARVAVDRHLESWTQALLRDFANHAREELPRRTKAESRLSFDDLLLSLRAALRGPRGKALSAALRRRFPAGLIDEFHDTDPVQYEIFERIYDGRGTALYLIGDPKQAIYSFRGADVFSYIDAARKAQGRFTLATNYRSDPSLVRAVNTVFSRPRLPFLLESIRFDPVTTPDKRKDELVDRGKPVSGLEFVFLRRPPPEAGKKSRGLPKERVSEIVAADIARTLGAGLSIGERAVVAGDFAVLTRTNAEAGEVQRALRGLGIPAVFQGDASVLDTEEASELALVLAALADPSSGSRVRAALATSLLGLDAAELFRLGEDESAWERWVASFASWHALWESRGFLAALRALTEEHRVSARLLGTVGGERRLTNFLHLVELCHRQSADRGLGVAGLIAWFDEVRHDREARDGLTGDEQQIRLESDEHAVQLTTMHRSKGLEYPIVYLSHLYRSGALFDRDKEQLAYHDPEDGRSLILDLRPEAKKPVPLAHAEEEAMAEAARLAYVALTRGKHRTVVVWGAFAGFHRSAAARLFHPTQSDLGVLEAATDEALRKDLDDLRESSGGAVTVREFDERAHAAAAATKARNVAEASTTTALEACIPSRTLSSTYRTSSFSALVRGVAAADAERDVDPVEPIEPVPPEHDERAIPLDEFPRGPRAGDAIHLVLEHADFQDATCLPGLVEEHLGGSGFDVSKWAGPLAVALGDVLRTPLVDGDGSFSLSNVPASRRLAELEFTFPVGEPTRKARGALTSEGLAGALGKSTAVPVAYVERVRSLPFAPLAGFLRGFIDLVFEHDGRFYVVDYKSNHLGPSAADYARRKLERAMAEHHYFLQYHLYTVAVHRYLGARVPGYDYERHFGGVLYLFLRGMHPELGPGHGVYFDKPELSTVERLSRVLSRAKGRDA